MNCSRIWSAWLLIAVAACASATEPTVPPAVTPPTSTPLGPPTVPAYTSLHLSYHPPILVAGGRVFVGAHARRSSGEIDLVSVRWESTDTTRLRPDLSEAGSTWIRAVGTGDAVVSVRLGDLSSSAEVTVIPRPATATAPDTAPAAITDFHVVKMGQDYFFPRIAMRALRPEGVVVVEMTLALSGVPTPLVCLGYGAIGPSVRVAAGNTNDDDFYSDYPYDVRLHVPNATTSLEATVSMVVTDGYNRSWRIDATGPVVSMTTPPPFPTGASATYWGCDQ